MKKINKKSLVDKLGVGFRVEYLQKNPHGYSTVTKVHKSKKTYNRKNKLKTK